MPEELRNGQGVATPACPWNFATENRENRRFSLAEKCALFSSLSPQECKGILATAREQVYERRQIIHFEGDPVRQVVLLTSGCAKTIQVGQNGTEVILRLAGPGEVVGTVGLGGQTRHCSMAQALRTSTALVWEVATFEAISQRMPVIRRNSMEILGKQLEDMQERFREISTEKVASRLSRQLMRLLDQVGRQLNDTIEISLSREELAQLIGTTLFTVSRLLSDWDQRGIVATRREGVSVRDVKALARMSECED